MDRVGLAILEQELKADAAGVAEAFPEWAGRFCTAIRTELGG